MITVADIIALPAFDGIELVVSVEGACGRDVRNVGILDTAPDKGYDDFLPWEFVVTNLGFACGDERLVERSLVEMAARGVAAIAVKASEGFVASEAVRRACVAHGVPLFRYEGSYHEVVAYQALDLINQDRDESDKGRVIDALLSGHDGNAVRDALYRVAGVMGSTLQCAALAPASADECSLYATLDALNAVLSDYANVHGDVDRVFACRYHATLVAFVSRTRLASAHPSLADEVDRGLIACLRQVGHVRVGLGEEGDASDGDLCMREALAALRTAQTEGLDVVRWGDLRHDAFRAAAAGSRLFDRVAAYYRAQLAERDEAGGCELYSTMRELARAYGDVRAAAEVLHLHPNTIRYRMRQAKAALGMSETPDREFAFFLGLVFLDQTNPWSR